MKVVSSYHIIDCFNRVFDMFICRNEIHFCKRFINGHIYVCIGGGYWTESLCTNQNFLFF